MNKLITLISLLWLLSFYGKTQNYQPIHPEKVYTYQFTNLGVSFIRVLSVNESEAGTTLHFAPNIQETGYNCYDPFGATWLGPKVIVQENGDNLFFNLNNDTIRIKTQASEGDTWMVYQDENRVIQGRVAEIKISEVLDQPDSVKVIEFRVFNPEMEAIEHLLNHKTIELSKNFGFTKVLPLLRFPDMTRFSEDIFESSLLGISDPPLGIRNITWLDVMDFKPGDEIHVIETTYNFDPHPINSGTHRTINSIFRYLEREDLLSSIIYRKERIKSDKTVIIPENITTEIFTHDTLSKTYAKWDYFDVHAGEPIKGGYLYSNTTHIQFGSKILGYRLFEGDEHCMSEVLFSWCIPLESYLRGLGGPYYDCSTIYNSTSRELVFYKKGGISWGHPLMLTSSPEIHGEITVNIYPNPVTGDGFNLRISQEKVPLTLEILDLAGRIVYRKQLDHPENYIQTRELKKGIYIYRVLNSANYIAFGRFFQL